MHPSPRIEVFARTLDAFGRRWHRYEVRGAENIPAQSASLLVMYHGFMPLDAWLFLARMYLERGRLVRPLTDRFMVEIPAFRRLVLGGGAIVGDPEAAARLLADGETVLVAPGGVREAIAGRAWHYRVRWGDRLGFARLALQAKVPLIPMFTENCEEIYRSPFCDRRPFQAFYEKTRLPIVPVAGLGLLPFPVKLTTWFGTPIEPRGDETPEALRDRVRDAVQALIDAHHGRRPRLARAVWQRLTDTPHKSRTGPRHAPA